MIRFLLWRCPLVRLVLDSQHGVQLRETRSIQRMKANAAVITLWKLLRGASDTEQSEFWRGSRRRLRELAYPSSAEDECEWENSGNEWVEEYVLHGLSSEPMQSWRVAEIGCGPGRLLGEIAKRFEFAIGIDFSPAMVHYARNRLRGLDNVRVLRNDGMTLPLKDSSMNFVYSVLVFQHMGSQAIESYFSELARVLQPGGLFRFQTRWDLKQRDTSSMDRHFLSKSDVETLASLHGFEILDYRRGLGHPLFHWFTLRKADRNREVHD